MEKLDYKISLVVVDSDIDLEPTHEISPEAPGIDLMFSTIFKGDTGQAELTHELVIELSVGGVLSGMVFPVGTPIEDILREMFTSTGVINGCLYGGVVNPGDFPIQGDDHRYYYLAITEGRYTHFNNYVVDGYIVMFSWSENTQNWRMLALWPNDQTVTEWLENKANIVYNAIAGHLASLDEYGNPTDSGIAADDVVTTVDSELSSTSENPVQNKVIKSIIDAINAAKQDLLPDGSVFGGFVNPSSVPDTKYYYLTDLGGLYPYFDNTNVNDNSLTLFYYQNNSWQNAIIAPSYQFASALYDGLEGKQDIISDLAAIRNGAAAGATSIQSTEKGAASGVATLDSGGKVPQSQLPSYVDDVLEYANITSFPVTGESGKIYVALDTNKTYRWSGSAYVEIAQGLALGETSSTAFPGDRGKAIEDKIPSSASSSNKLATALDVSAKYTKPSTGIPKTDLESGVQTSLGKADTALQTETDPTVPSWAKQSTKPSYDYSEIGNTPDLSEFITKSVNDLTNYYLKSETYTKAEVAALIGAIQSFHYEIYTTLPASGEGNVLYLIGPTGTGVDKYEEYVYSDSTTGWVKIGDTSIDLSNYITTSALNTALAAYTTTSDLTTLLEGYQTKIDSQHKLDYSLIDNTPTIPTVPTNVSAFTNDAGYLTQHQDISGKADKVSSTTSGNFAGLDSSGNLTDSGSNSSDFATSAQGAKADSIYTNYLQAGSAQGETTIPNFDAYADTVHITEQSLSSSQKTQARTNIGSQEMLVSGTNIKTINNESILGSGNITIQGGGGGGEENVIESISINGTAQTVTNKNVDLAVPTSTAVYQIVSISQSAYDALVSGGTVSSTTLYLITS